MTEDNEFIACIIVALARTWDSKLPGFLKEFQTQIDVQYLQASVNKVELRADLDTLSLSLRE